MTDSQNGFEYRVSKDDEVISLNNARHEGFSFNKTSYRSDGILGLPNGFNMKKGIGSGNVE